MFSFEYFMDFDWLGMLVVNDVALFLGLGFWEGSKEKFGR